MNTFLIILCSIFGSLFGWFCGEVIMTLREANGKNKQWIGWVVTVLGILFAETFYLQNEYEHRHRIYDTKEYKVVNDTTITNHNGQIDTVATFKIVKK